MHLERGDCSEPVGAHDLCLEAWIPIPCLLTLFAVGVAAVEEVEVTVAEAVPEVLEEAGEEKDEHAELIDLYHMVCL